MYRTRRRKSRHIRRGKSIGFKKRLSHQKRKSKKYNTFRVARGGIRL